MVSTRYDFGSLVAVAEKYPVVIDIGSKYIKCGFGGEFSPRAIIPTAYRTMEGVVYPFSNWQKHDKPQRIAEFKRLLHDIFYTHLLTVPKDRRVIIVESVLCSTKVRQLLAELLFDHYDVPSLLFAPSHLLACFPFRAKTALVVDVGHKETLVLPVCQEVVMLNQWEASPLGGFAVEENLKNLLINSPQTKLSGPNGVEMDIKEHKQILTDTILEDIKVRYCFVTTFERGRKILEFKFDTGSENSIDSPPDLKYRVDGDKILLIPGSVREQAAEVLFARNDDSKSIPQLIVDCVLKASLDLRRPLMESLLIVGGGSMLPGFYARLRDEIKDLLQETGYDLAVKFFRFPGRNNENWISWLGGSLFGDTDFLALRSLTNEEWQKSHILPDWVEKISESCGGDDNFQPQQH